MRDPHPSDEDLTAEEIGRYSRHLTLPGMGLKGQKRLKNSSALIVGAGGLGAPISTYLTAAGVGRIGIVEFDRVESSNLQRQLLFETGDIGRPKLEVAVERLRRLNPHIDIVPHAERLDGSNALRLLADYDVILDGTDNFATRYLINDACVRLGKPDVYGSIFRFEGQVSIFWAQRGPCYRCLFPDPPPPGAVPDCAEGGVLGVLPGTVGTLQATEAIKLMLGAGKPLIGRLLLYDALSMQIRELELRKDPDCPGCGPDAQQGPLQETAQTCETPLRDGISTLTVSELATRLEAAERPRLLDVRTAQEREICRLPDAVWIPLDQLEARWGELVFDVEWVVYCHSGIRSASATHFLVQQGVKRVSNLSGGIDAWSREVDPQVPRY